ncbi:MAG: hypothetical protein A2W23_04465 [Planctomycetes bacterium RBG_16_43_13]|nr:MAG: hypothetical protein A2W23_04465 [Planctomycetes bacterium RBG_16_43_13]
MKCKKCKEMMEKDGTTAGGCSMMKDEKAEGSKCEMCEKGDTKHDHDKMAGGKGGCPMCQKKASDDKEDDDDKDEHDGEGHKH